MIRNRIKKRTRKKMNRSGFEKCPICNNMHILVEHHINGRKVRDSEKEWNKAYICDVCHRLIHEGIIIIEKWVLTTDGLKLFWHKKGEKGITGNISKPHIIGYR